GRRCRRGTRELEIPGRQESRARGRRGSDLVRTAETVPEPVLPYAARPWVRRRQRGVPRPLPLAARRSARLRALVREHHLGPDVPPLRANGPAGDLDHSGDPPHDACVPVGKNSLKRQSFSFRVFVFSWQILDFKRSPAMNTRRIALAALIAWVVDSVYGFVVFGLLLNGQFAKYPGVFRSFEAVNS